MAIWKPVSHEWMLVQATFEVAIVMWELHAIVAGALHGEQQR